MKKIGIICLYLTLVFTLSSCKKETASPENPFINPPAQSVISEEENQTREELRRKMEEKAKKIFSDSGAIKGKFDEKKKNKETERRKLDITVAQDYIEVPEVMKIGVIEEADYFSGEEEIDITYNKKTANLNIIYYHKEEFTEATGMYEISTEEMAEMIIDESSYYGEYLIHEETSVLELDEVELVRIDFTAGEGTYLFEGEEDEIYIEPSVLSYLLAKYEDYYVIFFYYSSGNEAQENEETLSAILSTIVWEK